MAHHCDCQGLQLKTHDKEQLSIKTNIVHQEIFKNVLLGSIVCHLVIAFHLQITYAIY